MKLWTPKCPMWVILYFWLSVFYRSLSIACHSETLSALPTAQVPSVTALQLGLQCDYIGHKLLGKLEDNKHQKSIFKTSGKSTNVAIICGEKNGMAIWLMIPLEVAGQSSTHSGLCGGRGKQSVHLLSLSLSRSLDHVAHCFHPFFFPSLRAVLPPSKTFSKDHWTSLDWPLWIFFQLP